MVRDTGNPVAFYALGGSIEPNESAIDCLKREVKEEVGTKIKEDSIKFLAEFENVAHGKANTRVNIQLFSGKLVGEPQPTSEIVEIRYFSTSIELKHQTPIGLDILHWLKEHDYID